MTQDCYVHDYVVTRACYGSAGELMCYIVDCRRCGRVFSADADGVLADQYDPDDLASVRFMHESYWEFFGVHVTDMEWHDGVPVSKMLPDVAVSSLPGLEISQAEHASWDPPLRSIVYLFRADGTTATVALPGQRHPVPWWFERSSGGHTVFSYVGSGVVMHHYVETEVTG